MMAPSACSRLLWIQQQLQIGRQASVAISHNSKNASDKIKVVLEPLDISTTLKSARAPFIDVVLQQLQLAIHGSIVIDKGHCASGGRSIIEFWIKPAPASTNYSNDLPPPAPPVLEHPILLSTAPPLPSHVEVHTKIDSLQQKINELAERMHLNVSYSHCMYPMLEKVQSVVHSLASSENSILEKLESDQSAASIVKTGEYITRLDRKIVELIGEVDASHLSMVRKIDALSQQQSASPVVSHSRYYDGCSEVAVQWPEPRMKRYKFLRSAIVNSAAEMGVGPVINSAVQASLVASVVNMGVGPDLPLYSDAYTQITAREFHDEMSDVDGIDPDCELNNPASSNESEEIVDEIAEVSDEEVVSLPRSEVVNNPYFRLKVKNLSDGSTGKVQDIVKGEKSGTIFYEIRYAGNATEHVDLDTLLAMRNYRVTARGER